MNIIFMRHGEAVDNVRGVLSCKEIRCSTLTEVGFRQVAKSINKLPREIDMIYSSPLVNMMENLIIQNLMRYAPGKRREIFLLGLGNTATINIAWS